MSFQELMMAIKDKSTLNLLSRQLTDEDISQLSKINPQSKTIVLSNNKISRKGMLHFCKAKWDNLVDLDNNNIGNVGCKFLSRIQLKQLQVMGLGNNAIDSTGVLHLSKSEWKQNHEISLTKNMIGVNGIKWLIRTYSNVGDCYICENRLSKLQILHLLLSEYNKGDNPYRFEKNYNLGYREINSLSRLMRLKYSK